jgi:hypothetical protein
MRADLFLQGTLWVGCALSRPGKAYASGLKNDYPIITIVNQ